MGTRRIGEIRSADGRVQEITAVDHYGVNCQGITTNGDPRYVAHMAATREAIVRRHHDEGLDDYSLQVIIGDRDISDLPFEEALAVIREAAGMAGYRDLNFDLMTGSFARSKEQD